MYKVKTSQFSGSTLKELSNKINEYLVDLNNMCDDNELQFQVTFHYYDPIKLNNGRYEWPAVVITEITDEDDEEL